MALFDNSTPILRFKHAKNPNVRWVLWPVFIWRVVAPVPRERKLNLFQYAILGLARAGISNLESMGKHLLIAPDLARLVVQELQNMGLINFAGKPTERGVKALEELEEVPLNDISVGHVISDVFNGKVWPRFLTGDLPVVDAELNNSGRPVLLSGSAGDPWSDKTFSIQSKILVKTKPSPRDILRAARRHRRQRDFDEVYNEHHVPLLNQISFVDDQPQPYFLALCVRRHDSGDWMVDDPLGHGESTELRARLEQQMDAQRSLRSWLAPLVGADVSEPTLKQFQIEAAWKVEDRLTLGIKKYKNVHKRLVAMQRALLEAGTSGAPADKWDDVLLKAQCTVERVLLIVHQRQNDVTLKLFEKLARDDQIFNQKLLNKIADNQGFKSPLPPRLSSVRRGKIQFAEESNGGGLRPLLLLNLLHSDVDDKHPFSRIGKVTPDLLYQLNELASARDKAGHDSDKRILPERVKQHVETTYVTVEKILLLAD